MSKLILFLFLGVCVVAVHMAPAVEDSDDEIDPALEELVNEFEPILKQDFEEVDPKINWKKVWKKAKPILIQVGKVAGGAAVAAALGG